MPHLDEGTIHAWLDGALSAAEAAAVEAHVAGCPDCRARLAEARGLIAGSSRILSALDQVPGGVVPERVPEVTRPRGGARWVRPITMAIAATLVLAVGTMTYKTSDMRTTIVGGETAVVKAPVPAMDSGRREIAQEQKQRPVPADPATTQPNAQPRAAMVQPLPAPPLAPNGALKKLALSDSVATTRDSMHLPANERRMSNAADAAGAVGRGGSAARNLVTTATGEQRKVELGAVGGSVGARAPACYAGLPGGVVAVDSARLNGDSVTITLAAPDGRVLHGVREGAQLRVRLRAGDTTTVLLAVAPCPPER